MSGAALFRSALIGFIAVIAVFATNHSAQAGQGFSTVPSAQSCADVNPLCVPVGEKEDEIFKACVTAENCGGAFGGCSDKCRVRFQPTDTNLQRCIDDCQPAFARCIRRAEQKCRNRG